jgi:hypothetical protein
MTITIDLAGERFERLLVLSQAPKKSPTHKNADWICQCDCGTIKTIRGNLLRTGATRSCGCLSRETASRLMTTHGLSKTPEFAVWHTMKARCYNPKNHGYKSHGARGITVCERWLNSFVDFRADMGQRPSKKHSIDRIDNDGNYTPENCRWATASMQGRNTSRNNVIEIDGVSLCVADWCDLMDVDRHKPYNMVYWNKRSGISSVDEAVRVLYDEWHKH